MCQITQPRGNEYKCTRKADAEPWLDCLKDKHLVETRKRKAKKQSEATDTVRLNFHLLAPLSVSFYQPGQICIFHPTGLPADAPSSGD